MAIPTIHFRSFSVRSGGMFSASNSACLLLGLSTSAAARGSVADRNTLGRRPPDSRLGLVEDDVDPKSPKLFFLDNDGTTSSPSDLAEKMGREGVGVGRALSSDETAELIVDVLAPVRAKLE
jgi:hypothetical protein